MDIRMNNMNWFSGYSLMNRLFSQKNGNQAGIPNPTGGQICGRVKYKHSNMYYDENGISWKSKEQADV